jgi:hypothetical protein
MRRLLLIFTARMREKFFRRSSATSLLKKKSGKSLKILCEDLGHLIRNNNDYLERCLSQVDIGKRDFKEMLDDARRVIFTKEELINWLYRIKQDAETETKIIFAQYYGSLGMEESKIDFERAGFLAGVFEEAEHYLTLIVAIEPLDKNKPHYAILDRLEELDEFYVKKDNIPGYYSIQKDKKISKHKYEIKNLDDYWTEHLALKDKHQVLEGFGDIRHLLSQYHAEFKWELVQIRPREEIKDFLNFQLKKYIGDPTDFLNHIEFRIMPQLDWSAGSDYPIYQLLIKDWLKEKRNKLNQVGVNYLVESVASVSASFIDNVTEFRKSQDENKYNISFCLLLNQRFSSKGWTAKDQSMGGSTDSESKANRAGIAFRDIIVVDEKNHHLSAMECFRLKYVPNEKEGDSEISIHLTKIFRNEPLGLSPLFIIVYCETKSFSKTWEKYLNYIEAIDFDNYKLLNVERNFNLHPERSNIRIARAKHLRETNELDVFHFFINMYP